MSSKTASIVATLVLLASVAALLGMRALLGTRPFGLIAQGIAFALMVAARVTFGLRSFHAGANPTEGGLVTHGPYRWMRHPIYAAILVFVWSGALSHASMPAIVAAAIATAATAVRIGGEERLVAERYPEYVDYAARTKRLIPFVF